MTTMLYAFIDSIISLLRIYDIIQLKENCNNRMLTYTIKAFKYLYHLPLITLITLNCII